MNQLESPSKLAGPGGLPRRTIGQRFVQYWPHYLIIVLFRKWLVSEVLVGGLLKR